MHRRSEPARPEQRRSLRWEFEQFCRSKRLQSACFFVDLASPFPIRVRLIPIFPSSYFANVDMARRVLGRISPRPVHHIGLPRVSGERPQRSQEHRGVSGRPRLRQCRRPCSSVLSRSKGTTSDPVSLRSGNHGTTLLPFAIFYSFPEAQTQLDTFLRTVFLGVADEAVVVPPSLDHPFRVVERMGMAPSDETRWQTTRVQDVVRAQVVVPNMAHLMVVLVALRDDGRFDVGHVQRDDNVGTGMWLQCLVYGSMVDDEDQHVVEITVCHTKAQKTFDDLGESGRLVAGLSICCTLTLHVAVKRS